MSTAAKLVFLLLIASLIQACTNAGYRRGADEESYAAIADKSALSRLFASVTNPFWR